MRVDEKKKTMCDYSRDIFGPVEECGSNGESVEDEEAEEEQEKEKDSSSSAQEVGEVEDDEPD